MIEKIEPNQPHAILRNMPKPSSHVLELAQRGAELRLRELSEEAKHLIGLFPRLRDAFDNDELPVSFVVARDSGRLKPARTGRPTSRRTRRMSAAERKAVSLRMKRYWAARRKAQQVGRRPGAAAKTQP